MVCNSVAIAVVFDSLCVSVHIGGSGIVRIWRECDEISLEGNGENMSDDKLCELVAELWVDYGGDAEGFAWCYSLLVQAIELECSSIEERKAKDER